MSTRSSDVTCREHYRSFGGRGLGGRRRRRLRRLPVELGGDPVAEQDAVGLVQRARRRPRAGRSAPRCAAPPAGRRRTRGRRSSRQLHGAAPVADRHAAQRAARAAQAHRAGLGRDLRDRRLQPVELGRPGAPASRGARRPRRPPPSARAPRRASARRRSRRRRSRRARAMPRSSSSGAAARQTASASGLPRPASSPWASTSPPTSVSTTRSQPSSLAGVRQRGRHRGRAVGDVEQQDRLAEVARHVRLGEPKAARARGVRAGQRGMGVERLARR